MPDPDVVQPHEPKRPAPESFADTFGGQADRRIEALHHTPRRDWPRSGARATSPPDADSYYGRPIIKQPVWKPEIGWYFFSGGLAGASCALAAVARAAGHDGLARRATLTAFAGVAVSPPLLIVDLGRPQRFLNMLRVFKVTSPMSVGSWVLAALGTANGTATACELTGRLPRVRSGAEYAAGVLGPVLSTYTAALLADTAVPVWHDARRQLPLVFAGSSAASAGAASLLLAPDGETGAGRALLVGGAAVELAAVQAMERCLGALAEPYHEGRVRHYAQAAKALTAGGAALALTAGRRRLARRTAAALVLAGSACERFAVLRAGNASALDPRATVEPQRRRLAERSGP